MALPWRPVFTGPRPRGWGVLAKNHAARPRSFTIGDTPSPGPGDRPHLSAQAGGPLAPGPGLASNPTPWPPQRIDPAPLALAWPWRPWRPPGGPPAMAWPWHPPGPGPGVTRCPGGAQVATYARSLASLARGPTARARARLGPGGMPPMERLVPKILSRTICTTFLT